jgi:DNA repair exonuclease SbcCD nuclease subunit
MDKLLNTADWHYALYHGEGKSIEGTPEKLFYIIATCRNMCEYAVKNSIEYIAILGDIYHTKSVIYTQAQDELFKIVREYKDKICFIFLQGNHDLSSRSDVASSTLEGFRSEPNVIVITKTTTLSEIPDSIFIPYTPDIVNDVKSNSSKNLFSHFGVSEARLNSGISIISDIRITDLKARYENVFLGHYHMPQDIILTGFELFYTGSPIQLDLGEKNQEKRFMVYDLSNGKKESVFTEGYKKIYEYTITNQNRAELLDAANTHKKNGHEVRFIRTDNIDVSDIVKDFTVVDRSEKDIRNRGLNLSMNDVEKIKRYMEIQGITDDAYFKFAENIIQRKYEENTNEDS